jgi:quercetin dioxygenase-like cupin family protein
VLVALPSGYAVAPHWHKHSEFFLIVKGNLTVVAGGKERSYGPGETLFLPANIVHSLKTGRFKECLFFMKTDGPVGFTYVDPEDRAR